MVYFSNIFSYKYLQLLQEGADRLTVHSDSFVGRNSDLQYKHKRVLDLMFNEKLGGE